MPLNLKVFNDLVNLINGKFNKEIEDIDPSIKASFGRGVSVSTAAGTVSLQEGIQDAVNQSFYQTADDEFLTLHGDYDKTIQFEAGYSVGQAAVAGVLDTIIPSGTPLILNGTNYLTTLASSVQEYIGNVELSYSAGIVTVVTDIAHTLSTGLEVIISGATQTEYNGTFVVTALDENTFTYELSAGGLGTDTGAYSSTYALLDLEAEERGDNNTGAGAILSIDVTDINTSAFVGVGGLIDGSDGEDQEDFRERIGENHNITPGIATPPSMKSSAKSIQGNTRVFIQRPVKDVTGGTFGEPGYRPQPGEIVTYVLRDNDPSITPSATKLQETKDKLISDGHWPTFLDEIFLMVLSPDLVSVDFNFTSITPNTVTMQNAIREQLVAFFEDSSTALGGTISLEKTVDPFLRTVQDATTGQFLTDFTYTVPSGDIVTDSGEVAVRGEVTFE